MQAALKALARKEKRQLFPAPHDVSFVPENTGYLPGPASDNPWERLRQSTRRLRSAGIVR